jgi:signal transduction histidine kinase
LRAAFQDRGVELTIEVPDDIPPVMADRGRIRLVFSNLLTNALKYTRPGGQVSVTAAADDAFVRFSVRDTGIGIPQQYQARIYERFFRVPGQSGGTGAGLGLAIAREIVEAHGGHISLESREGTGSTFSFTLARAKEISQERDGSRSAMAVSTAGAS